VMIELNKIQYFNLKEFQIKYINEMKTAIIEIIEENEEAIQLTLVAAS